MLFNCPVRDASYVRYRPMETVEGRIHAYLISSGVVGECEDMRGALGTRRELAVVYEVVVASRRRAATAPYPASPQTWPVGPAPTLEAIPPGGEYPESKTCDLGPGHASHPNRH
jgi:hypothetical protein